MSQSYDKRYKEAIECYDDTIQIDPKYEEGWYYKAKAFDALGNHEEAITFYHKALEINPKREENIRLIRRNCFR